MKSLKDRWPVYLVNLISFLLLAYFILLIVSFFFWSRSSSGVSTVRRDGGSDHVYTVYDDPDSLYKSRLEDLSYHDYKRKTDSMNRVKDFYSTPYGSSSISADFFGVIDIMECDSCTSPQSMNYYFSLGQHRYYFYLGGFRLVKGIDEFAYPRLYYKKGGVSYLKYMRFDSAVGPDHKRQYEGHWINKVIHYRVYDVPGSDGTKRVLIPVSKTCYTILEITGWAFMLGMLLVCWSVLRKFMLVLADIARGNAFTIKNYERLFYITNVMVLIPAGLVITQVVLQSYFRSYYAGDLATYIDWGSYLRWLLVAVVVFLLALAFRKGHRIQQEQDLTI